MKKSFPIILFGFCSIFASTSISMANQQLKVTDKKASTVKKHNTKFKCDGRQYCSQMKTYAEAKYFNDHCPNTKMDGDDDGIPCERQFKKQIFNL